ncbi:hypothetical protein [Phenylobacterium conjunctum]|jgi:membrane-bound metal-dependent hydrolase YbcI (DUF457 family)|uniref:LexA-binding, inner membrane-associated hydrolase n=1 Tax=Phenylobacterium conjunctum TaxID=1298959 RepID=A0ABW3T038_9CAUL
MFVGHYAAALAAKAVEPRAPLWTYVGAAQLVDIAWSGLVMAGVERLRLDESLPGSPLVLEHMPWTHSLPAAVLWSLAAAVAVGLLLKLPRAAAVMVGLVAFSHWLGDLAVHRPDLELWFGGDKVGFGLWNYPVPEEALEMGLLGLGAAAWGWRRGQLGQSLAPVLGFTTFLIALQIVALVLPGSGDPAGFGRTALIAYLVTTVLAWLADRRSTAATS